MANTDLTAFPSVQTNLFVRIDVDNQGTDIWRFSDYQEDFEISETGLSEDLETYTGLGKLIDISRTKTEIQPSTNSVSITLSGVPNSEISTVLNARLKGSRVKIYRQFFSTSTGNVLTASPALRFAGIIKNYAIDEQFEVENRSASMLITLQIDSIVGYLQDKIVGRQTNPESMKTFYPSDTSFDRVPVLKNQAWNFGIVRNPAG
jgi:hypothetical protein